MKNGENTEVIGLVKHRRHAKEFMAAVVIALWVHVALFALAVLLLFWQVLSARVLPEEEAQNEETTEVVIAMEPDLQPLLDMAEEKKAKSAPEKPPEEKLVEQRVMDEPEFMRTTKDQARGEPVESEFIGERSTLARSEAGAKTNDAAGPAFRGERPQNDSVQSVDDRFQDGMAEGKAGEGPSGPGQGKTDQKAVKESEKAPAREAKKGAEEKKEAREEVGKEEFLEPEVVEEKLPTPEERKKQEAEKLEAKKSEEKEEREKTAAKKAGGGQGEFHSEARKTIVLGSLNAMGKASLDVKNTALGQYQKVMFREIERGWQEGNFEFRSHLVPGMVSASFVVDAKGKVSSPERLEMNGASQMQWGLVLRALGDAKIPPMPKAVRQELKGQELELSVTFNY